VLSGPVSAVDGDPGRDVWLAGGWDGEVGLRRGDTVRRLTAHAGRVNAVGLGAALIATVGDDGVVRRTALHAAVPESLPPVDVGRDGCATLALSTSGSVVLAGGGDGGLRLVDDSGAVTGITAGRETAAVVAVAVDPDGRFAAVGHADGVARVLDVPRLAWVAVCRGGREPVTAVAVTGSGHVATGSADGSVTWWPAGPQPDRPGIELGHHDGAVRGLAVLDAGGPDVATAVVSAGRRDRLVRLWPLPTTMRRTRPCQM
jgi:WD40 repeat protein